MLWQTKSTRRPQKYLRCCLKLKKNNFITMILRLCLTDGMEQRISGVFSQNSFIVNLR
jgi:hypothetical protein